MTVISLGKDACAPTSIARPFKTGARWLIGSTALLASLAGAATDRGPARDAGVPTAAIIAEEGFRHSEVSETSAYLADRIGGRLTNSPAFRIAQQWVRERLAKWGIQKVWSEPFPFGRGWSAATWSLTMTTPRRIQLRSIPVAWTPGTAGLVTASVVVAPLTSEAAFSAWHGKLAGKIVLVSAIRKPDDNTEPPFGSSSKRFKTQLT